MRLLPPGMEEGAFEREGSASNASQKSEKQKKSTSNEKEKCSKKEILYESSHFYARARTQAA